MIDTIRSLTYEELSMASKSAMEEVWNRLGHKSPETHVMEGIVDTVVHYGVTSNSVDPCHVLDFGDWRVRVVTQLIAEYLSTSYRGPANFGLLDRTRRLFELARY